MQGERTKIFLAGCAAFMLALVLVLHAASVAAFTIYPVSTQIQTGDITSAKILDGTIQPHDIASSTRFYHGSLAVETTTPWGAVSIEEGTTSPVFVVADQGTSSPSLLVAANGDVTIGGNIFKANGNVGFATTGPSQVLTVHRGSGNGSLGININNTLSAFGRDVLFSVLPDTNATNIGGFLFTTWNGGSGAINAVAISAGGSVGVATTTPKRVLHVVNAGANEQIMLEDSGGATNQKYGGIGFSNGQFSVNTMSDTGLATTTRVTITAGGSVGVATTSPATTFAVTGSTYTTAGLGVGAATTSSGNLLVTNYAQVNGVASTTDLIVAGVCTGCPGDWVQLASSTLTSATSTLNIAWTANVDFLEVSVFSTSTTNLVGLRFNNDAGSNYNAANVSSDSSGTGSSGAATYYRITSISSTSPMFATVEIQNTLDFKQITAHAVQTSGRGVGGSGAMVSTTGGGIWANNTKRITNIQLLDSGGANMGVGTHAEARGRKN